ncbi:MAG: ABC transporter permease [Alphaproteobacteria bacterium]|nr:ABC transporter permease [Alphaproteobacteria bacterium]
MSVRNFLLRRLVMVVPILLGITFLTFMLVRIGDQSPVAMLGGPMADEVTFAVIEKELGLDKPFFVQFGIYLGNLVQGDLGESWQSSERVADEIRNRLPASLELLVFSVLLGALVGVPVGLRSAQRPNGLFDQVSRFVSLFGFSVPTYWIALMSIFVFFFLLRWAPPPMGRLDIASFPPPDLTGSYFIDSVLTGNWTTAWSALGQLTLPVILFSIIVAAPIIKHTRAISLEVLASDYVRYARAQGLRPRTVRRVALRNAITPILTFIGTELTGLLAAVSLLELIFAWGGLGQWGLNAILLGDFAAVQGYVLVLAVFSVAIFIVLDLLVLLLEPRATLRP